MASPSTFEALLDAKTIGQANLANWSPGFDPSQYLSVLPHPDQYMPLVNGWTQWQQGNRKHGKGKYGSQGGDGSYYSSWGPSRSLNLTLRMSTLSQLNVPGLGEIRANPGETAFDSVYDNSFWSYNGQIPGPLLVANPGDTINIKLREPRKIQ
ncbi:multicopper oxidase domain-containing protein [Synechococcus sp. EJ6-Ellesmere]|nr:multicopper oxidase domain-containing protein [Synechococcus sp. EJ6-Ellesmere]